MPLAKACSADAHGSARPFADFLLFGVTAAELVLLFALTATFEAIDWIYVLQHLVVLGIAVTRRPAKAQDRTIGAAAAVAVSYAYPYAQVLSLRWVPGETGWPVAGLILVTVSAIFSLISLPVLGRFFGIRPALRGLVKSGHYALVRHPMYLAYIISDVGYNLQEWNLFTVSVVIVGWAALVYRIRAEERILSRDERWPIYVASVRYRLVPGLW